MPTAWFLVPYRTRPGMPWKRYCAMDDFTAVIWADNGHLTGNTPDSPEFWSETEVLGDRALVKVRASAPLLQQIAAEPGFQRIPKDILDETLADLTVGQRTALRDLIEGLGYPRAEWQERLGTDLGSVTLRQVLRFIATRRRKARYDQQTQTIIFDGEDQSCRPIEAVEGTVP